MAVCQSCGYEWEYSGKMDMTTCPNCQSKTPIQNAEQVFVAGSELNSRIERLKEQLADEGEYLHVFMELPETFPGEISVKAEVSDEDTPTPEDRLLHVRTEPLSDVNGGSDE